MNLKKEKTLDMIGNAHIDAVWLWQWPDGFQEIKATFRSVLDRMKEYEDFIFTSSSASYYEWVEKNDPEMFLEVKARIKEGRWVICGGWWIQPDCTIPCGESFVRQGLYGQGYFREKFGVTATTGYNVDSFGHHGMMPQILKKSGLNNYVFMRPGPHEMGLPGSAFVWKSGDGSWVKAYRIPYEYCSWGKELEAHISRCADLIKGDVSSVMSFYGVGNHGGGPTKENIDSIHRLDKLPDYPNLKLSTPDRYFDSVDEKKLPVVCSDLLHHASGCYSVHSEVKMLNRKAENRLMAAEKLSVLSVALTNHPYNHAELTRGWKKVLFNQFHDILAGTSIQEAYDDARDSYGEALNLALESLNDAVQAISWKIDIGYEEEMRPIVVFNPCGFETSVEVELESKTVPQEFALFDSDKKEIPFQRVHSSATTGGRCKICFIAEMPAMGYRLFCLRKVEKPTIYPTISSQSNVLENSLLRLELDPQTGYIKSLFKKDTEMELIKGMGGVPLVINDNSDTWSHGVRRFGEVVGQFKATNMLTLEQGGVKSVIRVVSEYERSKIIQDFTVFKDKPYVDVKVTVDWRERFKALKLHFPINLFLKKSIAEVPYGHTERALDGDEYPMQTWVDIVGEMSGKPQQMVGIAFINDGKTSYDIKNYDVYLTLLRSPIYAHHDPLVPDAGGEYDFIDQGIQKFSYRILVHDNGFEDAGVVKSAIAFNQKPFALFETYHQGSLPLSGSFIKIDHDCVVLSSSKLSEDKSGIILRLYETAGKPAKTTIELPLLGRKIEAEFGPMEIKTIYVPNDKEKPFEETNMLEDIHS